MYKQMFKKMMLSLLLTAVVVSMFPVRAFADLNYIHEPANLLKNPSFEEYWEDTSVKISDSYINDRLRYPDGWISTVGSWALSEGYGNYKPAEGKYFIGLLYMNNLKTEEDRKAYKTAELYQDVDVQAYSAGTVFKLSGTMFCYDQPPHDQAVMYLNFLDATGQILASKSVAHRSSEYKRNEIKLPKPAGAVKARIRLQSNLFVGSYNDGYFDAIDFRVADGTYTYKKVVISGKADAKAGETVQLSATNGITSNASDFIWRSEYESWAKVDVNGKVTLTSAYNPGIGVTIYAQDSEGNVGSFIFGNGNKNTDIEPDVNPGQNNTNIGGTQTTNTNIGGTQITTTNKDNNKKPVSGTKAKTKGKTTTLKWKKYKGAEYYLIHMYDHSKKKWNVKGLALKHQSSYKVTGLKKNVEYWFRITAEKRTKNGSLTLATSNIYKVKKK